MANFGKKFRVEDNQSQSLFQEFPGAMSNLPYSMRNELFELCEVVDFPMFTQVHDGYRDDNDIHLVCKGAALKLLNEQAKNNYFLE
jgi:hypothetical protein